MIAIILAGGKSKRMESILPKWALEIQFIPMIDYILNTLNELKIENYVCIREEYKDYYHHDNVYYQIKDYQESFGPLASFNFDENEDYLIINCDMPFITKDTILAFISEFESSNKMIGVVSSAGKDGVYDSISVYKEKLNFERKSKHKNMGIYLIKGKMLKEEVPKCLKEFDLTLPKFLSRFPFESLIFDCEFSTEFLNINTHDDLYMAQSLIQMEIIKRLVKNNNTIIDKNSLIIDNQSLIIESILYPNTKILRSTIYNSIIEDSEIVDSTIEEKNNIKKSVIIDSELKKNNRIGPFSIIRNSIIGQDNIIGSFVELNRTIVEAGNKLKHHLYLGDIIIGNSNNFGAMTVVSNYNGKSKANSFIKDNCFIGSFANIVSPIKIESNCYIASMTKLTQNLEPNTFIREVKEYKINKNTLIK